MEHEKHKMEKILLVFFEIKSHFYSFKSTKMNKNSPKKHGLQCKGLQKI